MGLQSPALPNTVRHYNATEFRLSRLPHFPSPREGRKDFAQGVEPLSNPPLPGVQGGRGGGGYSQVP